MDKLERSDKLDNYVLFKGIGVPNGDEVRSWWYQLLQYPWFSPIFMIRP
jgi:hypothetical protein